MIGYVYKVTHIPSGDYYIGKRQKSPNSKEKYFGSGRVWKKKLKKYPIEEFQKEVLGVYYSVEELKQAEIKFIGDLWKTDKHCLNQEKGGRDVYSGEFVPRFGKENPFYGHHHTEEAKEVYRQRNKGNKYHLGFTVSKKSRQIMSEKKLDYYKTHSGYWKGKQMTKNHKEKLSESHKGQSKGTHWFNNGQVSLRSFSCPKGFQKGRLK